MSGIGDEDRILVTSYAPDGGQDATVERVVELSDPRLACWTPDGTGLADRFAAAPVVSVRPCSRGGKPRLDGALLEGRAAVVTAGPELVAAREATRVKYGLGAQVSGALDRAREFFGATTPEAVVLITIVG